ncbi:MAG: hypothetical protein IT444_00945 [Phycisphaeraceae bacterium]|nr:hypothetical protein [Phycisphaeraceae bacterium]
MDDRIIVTNIESKPEPTRFSAKRQRDAEKTVISTSALRPMENHGLFLFC